MKMRKGFFDLKLDLNFIPSLHSSSNHLQAGQFLKVTHFILHVIAHEDEFFLLTCMNESERSPSRQCLLIWKHVLVAEKPFL